MKSFRQRVYTVILLATLFVSLMLVYTRIGLASSPTIYLVGPTTTAVGQNFTIKARVEDVIDLHAWQIVVNYDPALVDFLNASFGPFLGKDGENQTNGSEAHRMSNSSFIAIEHFPGGTEVYPGSTGSGTLLNMNFSSVATGECLFNLTRTRAFNSSTEEVPWNGYGDANGDGEVETYDALAVTHAFGTSPGDPWWDPTVDFDGNDFVDLFDVLCVKLNYGNNSSQNTTMPVEMSHSSDGYTINAGYLYETPVQNGTITTHSNVTLTEIDADSKTLNFTASGSSGQLGWVNVLVPITLNTSEIEVFINGTKLVPPPFPTITLVPPHYEVYFEFTLSTHNVTVKYGEETPAFPINWKLIDGLGETRWHSTNASFSDPSQIQGFNFNNTLGQISFNLTSASPGACNVTIPRGVSDSSCMDGAFQVYVNGTQVACLLSWNGTHTIIQFNYGQGTNHVEVAGQKVTKITGDLNLDGEVDIFDAVLLAGHYAWEEDP